MGIVASSDPTGHRDGNHATSESEMEANTSKLNEDDNDEYHDTIDEDTARAKAKQEEMDQFREQLRIKREQRREILDRHKSEKEELEKSLDNETKAKLDAYQTNRMLRDLLTRHGIDIPEDQQNFTEQSDISNTIIQMKEEFEKLKASNNKLRKDLAKANSSLQSANSDIADLNGQNIESIKQINALKEVVSVSKTMISLREEQLTELKNKVSEIEHSLADREANMLSANLRQEYERQLQNIRTLRGLYEERARLAEVTRQGLLREVEEQKRLKQTEVDKVKELVTKIEDLEKKVDELLEKIENKNNQIVSCQDETRGLQAEMSVVNKLFSQVLLGYKTKQDLDKLVLRLEENHGILTQMAENENDSEASSALPKLLLELVTQVEDVEESKGDDSKVGDEDKDISNQPYDPTVSDSKNIPAISPEEIVQHLPKVWRVLMELLSHQNTSEESSTQKVTTCYKSVETQDGPVLVPSVSQTYIRLKDLIIEKLTLIKEVNRMKQLNTHLESRLEIQEKKLSTVTTELSKTWHVVGRLRRYHHQLHTHERILKYELQQKRKLLNELKEELEYCKEKWEQAREKNSQSEKDLRKLRTEFSSRKTKLTSASLNNSAESGYSDERLSDSSDSNDESEYVAGSLTKAKKKNKKSFETIVDSSTDFNLAAEREDPVSDMIDVADLPLDNQDGDDHNEASVSDSYSSENILQSETVIEETEDYSMDIIDHSCTEDISTVERETSSTSSSKECTTVTQINDTGPTSTSREINIADQSEDVSKSFQQTDQSLADSSVASLQEDQNTAKTNKEMDNTLHKLFEQSSESRSNIESNIDHNIGITDTIDYTNDVFQDNILLASETELTASAAATNIVGESSNTIDFKAILENIKLQNERLARKDERLANLEAGCTAVVDNMSNIISSEDSMIEKLDDIHKKHNDITSDDVSGDVIAVDNTPTEDESQPSTSGEIDHEARFAARDLRLKRLEEQTKSLVKKVNKTNSKGVKIHYKLQELHNIYGSESSRAGTPSDNDESKSSNTDNESQDNSENPEN